MRHKLECVGSDREHQHMQVNLVEKMVKPWEMDVNFVRISELNVIVV